ncbi:MAG: hypothetical protein KGL39_19215 [Patescibacteria group bacterium]|nr:hypothetical protein [Patescibacteria group bacterium]
MAGPGTMKQTAGFADVFGGKLFNTIDYTGVASYVNGTGELLDPKGFGFPNTIESIVDISGDQSGAYYGICFPVNSGVTKYYIRWFSVATGQEVTNATNLSGKTLKISAVGF